MTMTNVKLHTICRMTFTFNPLTSTVAMQVQASCARPG